MHETGHLLGLSDRYDAYDAKNLGKWSEGHDNYHNDIMGINAGYPNAKLSFKNIYYKFYKRLGDNVSPVTNMKVINGRKIDVNENGHRIINYETGEVHKKKYNFDITNGDEDYVGQKWW